MASSLSGTVLKKKWKLGALVGKGGCAVVYEAIDVRASKSAGAGSAAAAGGPFVAKIAPLPVGLPPAMRKGKKRKKTEQEKHADMIYYEDQLYKGFLADHDGVVEIPAGGYGEDQNLRYLVMTRLGQDVEAAQEKSGGTWSVARKTGYARQMLALLRTLHTTCKMVFVDVKPENFMFGLPGSADEDKIFLVDFGLSSRFTGPGGKIKPQGQNAQVQGTPEFLSLKCHAGASPGRCDDLESLGYMIVSMLNEGSTSLPWSGSTSVASGLAAKKSTTLEELCQGCPPGMLEYMKAVRGMEYEDVPEYDKLDAMLQSMENASAGVGRGGSAATKAKAKPKAVTGNKSGRTRGALPTASAKSVPARSGAAKKKSPLEAVESEEKDEEMEVCVKAKGKGRAAEAQRTATLLTPVKAPPAPVSPKQRATTAIRRSRRLSSPKDQEEFFDALQEHDSNKEEENDDELEVTKVVRGATKRTGRGAATTGRGVTGKNNASSKATAKPKGVFLVKVLAGPHEGQTLRLKAGGAEVRVGRGAPKENGLRLDKDLEVSDKHAILRPQRGGISVEDVGSLNGSFVNEERLEGTAVLHVGDVFQVGQSVVKFTR